jgi:GNAT superfamily N-acetyltransferase
MTPLSIRAAQPGDGGLVADFVRKLAEYENLSHEAVGTVADFEAALFGPNPRVFADIAAWDGIPVGFALWFYTFSTFQARHGIFLEDLYVEPETRGRGIGKALIAHLARRCIAEGLPRLDWQVLDWNAPSIAFYDKIGATARTDWISRRLEGNALIQMAGGATFE